MEIRTLGAGEQGAWLDLVDGWEMPDGWSGRDFFARWIDLDPTWDPENVWVASERGQLVSTVQIFPRVLRVLDYSVPTGGIGSVYTRENRRRTGVAGALLERALEDMRARGMELSLLFATRFAFYGRYGWACFANQRAWIRHTGEAEVASRAETLEIGSFDRERDFAELKALQLEYSRSRSGTVVRDDALWEASFDLAGNPGEELIVARRDGRLVASLRLTRMLGRLVATELARADDADPLAELIASQLRPRKPDRLCAPDQSSQDLRSALLLPSFDDLPLTVSLEQRGMSAQVVDDPTNMLQCLDVEALGARLDVPVRAEETPSEFLRRVLPPESFVFWPADRF